MEAPGAPLEERRERLDERLLIVIDAVGDAMFSATLGGKILGGNLSAFLAHSSRTAEPHASPPASARPAATAPGADVPPTDDPWAQPPAFLAAGSVIAGRYRLDRRIARGGMGSIWAGVDTTLDRQIAVKFLAAGLTDDAVCRERFDREAKAVAQMRTPHVAMVHDHGVERS